MCESKGSFSKKNWAYCKKRVRESITPMTTHLRKTMCLRCLQAEADRLKLAAAMLGTSVNEFIVSAALAKAETVIADESTMILSQNESMQLLRLIENPPPRNEKFQQAMARYHEITSK